MDVTININLTPAEARQLMGHPDVQPLHDAALANVEQKVMTQAERFSSDALMNTWFAGSPAAAEMFRDMISVVLSQGRAKDRPWGQAKRNDLS